MYNYKRIFSAIKTPDEWKNNLYKRINGETEENAARRTALGIKKPMAAIISAAAVLAMTVTAAAFTGLFDIGSILRNDLNDRISYEKLFGDDYQPLDAAAENDKISVKAIAFLGDRLDSFVILEARLKDSLPDGFLRLGLDMKVFGEDADGNNYIKSRYYGIPKKDENGDDIYIFRVRVPSYWAQTSADSGIRLNAMVTGVCFERELKDGRKIAPSFSSDMSLLFSADGSVLKDITEITLDNYVSTADGSFTLRNIKASEYCERLSFDFIIPDDPSGLFDDDYLNSILPNISDWSVGEFYARKLLHCRIGDGKFFPEECPVRLKADGQYIPYLGNDLQASENAYYYNSEYSEFNKESGFPVGFYGNIDDDKKFSVVLCFEPFDFEAAGSVVIETETSEGVFETVTVK